MISIAAGILASVRPWADFLDEDYKILSAKIFRGVIFWGVPFFRGVFAQDFRQTLGQTAPALSWGSSWVMVSETLGDGF